MRVVKDLEVGTGYPLRFEYRSVESSERGKIVKIVGIVCKTIKIKYCFLLSQSMILHIAGLVDYKISHSYNVFTFMCEPCIVKLLVR